MAFYGVSFRNRAPGPVESSGSGLWRLDGFAVASQLLDHGAVVGECFQGAGTLGGRVELAIDVEDVLPGLAVDGAGLDFGEVGAQRRELGERRDQGAGAVFDRKRDADLICLGVGVGISGAADEEEAGVVFRVVLDAGGEDLGAVVAGGGFTGDGPGVPVSQLDQLLDAAGGVVEGAGLHAGMGSEKAAALGERHGMGEDAVDGGEVGAGDGDEVMADAQQGFALHGDVVGEEQVEVLGDGAGQRVFNGDGDGVDLAGGEGGKDVGGERDGDDFGVGDELEGGLVAEGAGLTLDGDLHGWTSFCCGGCWLLEPPAQLVLWHHSTGRGVD